MDSENFKALGLLAIQAECNNRRKELDELERLKIVHEYTLNDYNYRKEIDLEQAFIENENGERMSLNDFLHSLTYAVNRLEEIVEERIGDL